MLFSYLFTVGGICLLSKGYWNTFRPMVNHVRLKTDKYIGERPLRILHLSDIHIERLSIKPEKVVELVRQTSFDLIALTGDYLDKVTSIKPFLSFLEQICTIPSRYGIYAVWGNHDWVIAPQLPLLRKKMEALGVRVLSNESVTIPHHSGLINVIGIDDHHSGHSNVSRAFQGIQPEGFRLVLSHDPQVVKQISQPFDYLLCGHLHSGQIYYPLPIHSLTWGLKPLRKHLSGLQSTRWGPYYISAGLGQTGTNLRIGCRPEITIHHISPKAASRGKHPEPAI